MIIYFYLCIYILYYTQLPYVPVSGSKGPAPQVVGVGAATQEPAHAGNIGSVTHKT